MAAFDVAAAITGARRELDRLDDVIRKELNDCSSLTKAIQHKVQERKELSELSEKQLQPSVCALKGELFDLQSCLDSIKIQDSARSSRVSALKVGAGERSKSCAWKQQQYICSTCSLHERALAMVTCG